MTVAVLVARPPRAGAVLPRLSETSPLSPAEASDLSAAMLRDVAAAVDASAADLLVNYPADDDAATDDPEAALREVLADVGAAEDARFEPQVGSSFAARAGNAVTHLLEQEGEASAAVLTPDVPLLTRSALDEAAMRLRRDEVVLGPATEGRVYVAGFREPIDFADAYAPPALATLTGRGVEAGHDVGFLPFGVRVETGADLRSLLAVVSARRAAGRQVPAHTTAALDDFGLTLAAEGDRVSLARE
jgi:glycosyltransferase A (GT-A) superfamily protein (DUF2064 family)